MAERGGFEPPVQVLARTTVSQSAALFVEVEPNGFFRTSTVNRAGSLSINLAQVWHNQIPFSGPPRFSVKNVGS